MTGDSAHRFTVIPFLIKSECSLAYRAQVAEDVNRRLLPFV